MATGLRGTETRDTSTSDELRPSSDTISVPWSLAPETGTRLMPGIPVNSVGATVGVADGNRLGTGVGAADGTEVGKEEGSGVGCDVGLSVGTTDGIEVRFKLTAEAR